MIPKGHPDAYTNSFWGNAVFLTSFRLPFANSNVCVCVGVRGRACACGHTYEATIFKYTYTHTHTRTCIDVYTRMRGRAHAHVYASNYACLRLCAYVCPNVYVCVFGWHYLSKATCRMRPRLLYASFVVSRLAITCCFICHVWRSNVLDK